MENQIEKDYKSPILVLTRISLFKIPVLAVIAAILMVLTLFDVFGSSVPLGDDSLGWAILFSVMGLLLLAIPIMYGGILAILHAVFVHKRNSTGAFVTLIIYTISTFGIYVTYIPSLILELIKENDYEIDSFTISAAGIGGLFLLGALLFMILHIVGLVKLYKIGQKEKQLQKEMGAENNAQNTNN